MTREKPLYVALPMLPDKNRFIELIGNIWETRIVTNHGPYHNQLEARLRDELAVPTAMLFNNGTIALLAALKMFDFERGREVITTPLTFAATAHSIAWNGLTPVFADVDELTLTLDPEAVRKAITPRTCAILGVHTYGTVCALESLGAIALENNIKLIYDAAHAFGVTVDGVGIGNFGHATAFSFHATKLFNTIEGGAITTPAEHDAEKIYMLRNFGIKNEEEVVDIGINGKMNELQAAIGLLNLEIYRDEQALRARLRRKYDAFLSDLPGVTLQVRQSGITMSEQYYPIVIDSDAFGASRDDLYEALKRIGIHARKYFYPICTDFKPYKNYPIYTARKVAAVAGLKQKLLCLPFHSGVTDNDVAAIRDLFARLNNSRKR